MSPNSRKNLELGHKPNIRTSKDFSITRIIKEMLDEPADFLGANGKTWRQVIALKILDEARKGNATLIKELLDRLEGKVQDKVEISGKIGRNLEDYSTEELLAIIEGGARATKA